MNQHAMTYPRLPALHWSRIGATSITLALHLLAALLFLVPVSPPQLARPSAQPPIVINIVEPVAPRKPIEKVPMPVVQHLRSQSKAKPQLVPVTPPVVNTGPTPLSIQAPPTPTAHESSLPTAAKSEGVAYLGSTRVKYPNDALRAHEQGKVVLHVLVDADGIPETIEVATSSGSAHLDRAARDAVQHWHFAAATEDGVPKASWALVPVSFSLRDL